MIEHKLFPTLICEDTYENPQYFKKIFFDKMMDYVSETGYSEEDTGHVKMHLEPSYEPIYKFISEKAREYVNSLNVDANQFDFNIMKSWVNMTSVVNNNVHTHAEAHITFTYYVHVPEHAKKILKVFAERPFMNEVFEGFLNNNVKEWNDKNSLSWKFLPKDGDIFIFPARLRHSVESLNPGKFEPPVKTKNDLFLKRICIAGDILLTHKELTTNPMGLQPIKNWKVFE